MTNQLTTANYQALETANNCNQCILNQKFNSLDDGIKSVSVEKILTDYRVDRTIKLMRGLSPLPCETFEKLIAPLISEVVRHIHLLPASEAHHHPAPTGLLLHSLDTAHRSLTIAKAESETWTEEGDRPEPARWQIGALVAGLLQDVAVPYTNLWIQDISTGLTWDYNQPLADWLKLYQVESYNLSWKYLRGYTHRQHTLATAERIISYELKEFLIPIWPEIIKTFGCETKRLKGLAAIVAKANAASVAKNMAKYENLLFNSGSLPLTGYQLLVSIDAHLRSGDWSANQPDSDIFITKNLGVCIDLAVLCTSPTPYAQNEFPPLLKKSSSVRAHLLDAGLLMTRAAKYGDATIVSSWTIIFFLEENGNLIQQKRNVVRLREELGLFKGSHLPKPVHAEII